MRVLFILFCFPTSLLADVYLKCSFSFGDDSIRYIQIDEDAQKIKVWDYIKEGAISRTWGDKVMVQVPGARSNNLKYHYYEYTNLQTSENLYKAKLNFFEGIDGNERTKSKTEVFIIDRIKGISFHKSDESTKGVCTKLNFISFKYQVNNLEKKIKKTNKPKF